MSDQQDDQNESNKKKNLAKSSNPLVEFLNMDINQSDSVRI